MSFGCIVVLKRNGVDGDRFILIDRSCVIGRLKICSFSSLLLCWFFVFYFLHFLDSIRQKDCDIRIQLENVSKKHAQLFVDDNNQVSFFRLFIRFPVLSWIFPLSQVFVKCLSTHLPVIVNQTALRNTNPAVQLKHGDIFTVVERSFRFENGVWICVVLFSMCSLTLTHSFSSASIVVVLNIGCSFFSFILPTSLLLCFYAFFRRLVPLVSLPPRSVDALPVPTHREVGLLSAPASAAASSYSSSSSDLTPCFDTDDCDSSSIVLLHPTDADGSKKKSNTGVSFGQLIYSRIHSISQLMLCFGFSLFSCSFLFPLSICLSWPFFLSCSSLVSLLTFLIILTPLLRRFRAVPLLFLLLRDPCLLFSHLKLPSLHLVGRVVVVVKGVLERRVNLSVSTGMLMDRTESIIVCFLLHPFVCYFFLLHFSYLGLVCCSSCCFRFPPLLLHSHSSVCLHSLAFGFGLSFVLYDFLLLSSIQSLLSSPKTATDVDFKEKSLQLSNAANALAEKERALHLATLQLQEKEEQLKSLQALLHSKENELRFRLNNHVQRKKH